MNITQSLLARFVVLLFALATGTLSFAQGPGGVGGPPPPGGPGRPPMPPLAMLLLDADVVSALALTAQQQASWTALQAAQKAARTQGDAARTALEALVTTQFGSGAPDLVAIENALATAHATMESAMADVGTQAVACYAALSTGQQAIVVSAAVARYQKAQQH